MKVQQEIERKLRAGLNVFHLEVINESHRHQRPPEAESHFRIVVVATDFAELTRVQRQRKVFRLLEEELAGPLHALAQRALTPEEWLKEGQRDKFQSPSCAHQKG